jgi:flavin reductase (DIM6/NTAB) family NADH-FMN oxidoreductase RutF
VTENPSDGLTVDGFRAVMAAVCSPVTVVTALRDGRPHGTTVSSFCSLSLIPPMVSVALDRSSQLLSVVRRTRRMGVNLIGFEQHELALTFAQKGDAKFAGVAWEEDGGVPRLCAAPGWLACRIDRLVSGGDHVLALGIVLAGAVADAPPLIYQQRTFGTHSRFTDTPNA